MKRLALLVAGLALWAAPLVAQPPWGGGLPPGLAKRGGNLPPGLQKHLERTGHLPPGLEKKLGYPYYGGVPYYGAAPYYGGRQYYREPRRDSWRWYGMRNGRFFDRDRDGIDDRVEYRLFRDRQRYERRRFWLEHRR